jgi:hypothetical protein
MKRVLTVTVLVLTACAASAELKKSSRNLTPLLSKQTGAGTASARSGNTGLSSATPPREAAADTVTRVTFLGPKAGWGFVQETSPYYSPLGKNLGKLPGGTLFKYNDVKSTSKNAMLVATVKRGEAWEGPFLLDCTVIAAYEGDPGALSPDTVKDLGAYFTLKGKIADRKEALKDAALAANPHFDSARQSQQLYQASIVTAAEMEKRMLTLTGPRKTKADEALRALKYEQVRLKAKADAEARTYKAWKEAHPLDPAKLAADPQLQALERELAAAKAKVGKLAP